LYYVVTKNEEALEKKAVGGVATAIAAEVGNDSEV
jgi:hypothetical protein